MSDNSLQNDKKRQKFELPGKTQSLPLLKIATELDKYDQRAGPEDNLTKGAANSNGE